LSIPAVDPKYVSPQKIVIGDSHVNWADATSQQRDAAIIKNEPNLVKVFIKNLVLVNTLNYSLKSLAALLCMGTLFPTLPHETKKTID